MDVYAHVFRASEALGRVRDDLRGVLGLRRPATMLPHIGYAHRGLAVVRARVVEDRGLELGHKPIDRVLSAYRRYATREIRNAAVELSWHGHDGAVVHHTDREGHLDHWIEMPESVQPGWTAVKARLLDVPDSAIDLPVLVCDPEASFGVISDIDDTVIETGATNPLTRARALFWSSVEHRAPFEGVANLYRALAYASGGRAENPIFYLSSSPWNLHAHLVELFALNDIPRGPLLLRDWGLRPDGFAPDGKHQHKVDKARAVLDELAPLPFVLMGDTGQEDATHYATLVEEFADRIAAVYLRSVARRHAGVDTAVERIASAGVPVLLADDSAAMAEHAASIGLIPGDALAV